MSLAMQIMSVMFPSSPLIAVRDKSVGTLHPSFAMKRASILLKAPTLINASSLVPKKASACFWSSSYQVWA